MRTPKYDANDLKKLIKAKKVVTMTELKKVLAIHNANRSPKPNVITYINASTQSPILILSITFLIYQFGATLMYSLVMSTTEGTLIGYPSYYYFYGQPPYLRVCFP